jgi:hypothetical protein
MPEQDASQAMHPRVASQLDIFDVIADVDAALVDFPVRIRAWQKQRHSVTGLNDPAPIYVLEVAGDGREYTEITIGCREGWTAEESAGGTVYLLDEAGAVHLCHVAVAAGLVKIADVAAFPSGAATRFSKERSK